MVCDTLQHGEGEIRTRVRQIRSRRSTICAILPQYMSDCTTECEKGLQSTTFEKYLSIKSRLVILTIRWWFYYSIFKNLPHTAVAVNKLYGVTKMLSSSLSWVRSFMNYPMLCISTSERVLRTPFSGQNRLSDAKTTFSITNRTK